LLVEIAHLFDLLCRAWSLAQFPPVPPRGDVARAPMTPEDGAFAVAISVLRWIDARAGPRWSLLVGLLRLAP
jgi:hypothetical protein